MLLYVFLLLIVGVPLFFMELAAGQSIRQGSIGVWKHISPKLAGIGYSSCLVRGLDQDWLGICRWKLLKATGSCK